MKPTDKISRERLNLFVSAGKHYCSNNPRTKLVIAIEMLLPAFIKKLKRWELEKEMMNVDASEKEKHVPLKSIDGKYQITDAKLKELKTKILDMEEEECAVEVPIHIVNEFDEESLSYDLRRIFEGIVIPARNFEEEIENAPVKKEKV